jgi:ABC-type branched-subunit amino acid transport system substrate-binding protein
MPVKVFISYAHEDEMLLNELKVHLRPLVRQGLIELCYDRDVSAGTEWEQEIGQYLDAAQIILLLVSPDFLNSEYCYGNELERALERHQRGEVCVIPVVLRPVHHWEAVLGQLKALPKDALPITDPQWHNRDRAFHSVAEGLHKAVTKLTSPLPDLKQRKSALLSSSLLPFSPQMTLKSDHQSIESHSEQAFPQLKNSAASSNTVVREQTAATSSSSSLPDTTPLPETPPVPFPPPRRRRLSVRLSRRRALLAGLLILLLVLVPLLAWLFLHPVLMPDPIRAWTASNGELVGLSDGRYAFDTDRSDGPLKMKASEMLTKGDKVGAKSQWEQAVKSDTSDAEALIYLEDQRVLSSGSPYITLVVGARLTGDAEDVSAGRGTLQGAYVAQKEYNDGLKLSGGKLIRILIANAGSNSDYVTEVARLVVQAAKQDSTIIGVMGWSRSADTHKAIDVLSPAHIPMVSSTASADDLSRISPYFFRVAPPNKSQAIAGARYAEQRLHASRVALFVDPNNSFTSSLAEDFKQQFVADGNQIVDTENYTIGDGASLPTLLQKALNSNPDLIYFAGYVDDLAVLLVNLGTSQPSLQVLGGDSLYSAGGYPSSARIGFSRLRFTSFAYFDEWDILGMNKPQFIADYPNHFNPYGEDHSKNPYGFTRADYGVILSYDAMYALFQGCQNVLAAKNALTSDTLRHGLTQITGAKAIQGVSGQISFGSDGDPINKAVVILYVDQDGHIRMLEPDGVLGCYSVGQCG